MNNTGVAWSQGLFSQPQKREVQAIEAQDTDKEEFVWLERYASLMFRRALSSRGSAVFILQRDELVKEQMISMLRFTCSR